jgi:hypothetical protein
MMRIYGSNGTTGVASGSGTRRAASSGFALSEDEAPRSAGSASAPPTIGGIDALLALQGIEDPRERRKHAVKRGRVALDALDELKIGLLGGALTPATLTKLQSAAAYLKLGSGDENLDAVLDEIELRVEVEIAKMGSR